MDQIAALGDDPVTLPCDELPAERKSYGEANDYWYRPKFGAFPLDAK
jgi:hypothetical protein